MCQVDEDTFTYDTTEKEKVCDMVPLQARSPMISNMMPIFLSCIVSLFMQNLNRNTNHKNIIWL